MIDRVGIGIREGQFLGWLAFEVCIGCGAEYEGVVNWSLTCKKCCHVDIHVILGP